MKDKARVYYENKKSHLSDVADRQVEEGAIRPGAIYNVHLTGVCGTAMASLATLLKEGGYQVTGSDAACYPPMSTVLDDLGIPVLPFAISNLEQKDLIIIGNMCPPNNSEAVYARENKHATSSMSRAISELFIEDKRSIVVAGTHGKTTTTGMLIHLFSSLGHDPSYVVGGVMQASGSSAHYGKQSKHFIIEGDEYDTAYFDKSPKFLHYKPFYTIITSVELDHVDIYTDETDYRQAFKFLIEETHSNGTIFICTDDPGAKRLADEYVDDLRIVRYGTTNDAGLRLSDLVTDTAGQHFAVTFRGHLLGNVSIKHFGMYNALNALAGIGVALVDGNAFDAIARGVGSFGGMKRRQEVFGEKGGITVLDDFAHHPTAVQKTLQGIRERFGSRRIVAVFEPRSNSSRSKLFEDEYAKSFSDADLVIISTPKEKDGYTPPSLMNIETVLAGIREQHILCHGVHHAREAVEVLAPLLQSGDVVVVMSNGSFDGIHQMILDSISA